MDKAAEGYLIKSARKGGSVNCIHGGTTGTIIVVVDGHKVQLLGLCMLYFLHDA